MSEAFTRTGFGFYRHLKQGTDRWGQLQIQVVGKDTLLAQHSYTARDQALVTQGFLWHRLVEGQSDPSGSAEDAGAVSTEGELG